jgi:putative transposase
MNNDINFDMEAAIKALREGKDLSGQDGILTPLIKQLTEAAMKSKLDEHIATHTTPNRRNDSSAKTMKSPAGEFELRTPRDRAGTFEPQIVKSSRLTSPMNWSVRLSPCSH